MAVFAGAWTALVTPFRDGELDERALRDLVERQIAGGIDGLVPCGTTGENVTLSHAEYVRVVRVVVAQANRRVPVVAGSGTNSTRHTIELSHAACEAGASGLLLVVPYYNKPTQEGLVRHYRAVAEAVPLPSLVYNIPGRTGIDLSLATLGRLVDVPSIVGVKEATGNVLRSAEIAAEFGDRFTILAGDDALTLPVLAVGGHGVISVVSNVSPGDVARVVRLFREGDVAGARALVQRLRPLVDAMFVESNPGPVKAALAMLGVIAPELRLPMVMPSEASQQVIRAALDRVGLS